MPKILMPFALAAVLGLMGGCSNLEFPGVYKLTIEQGNIVTQEMVDQLEPGMSREQVEFVMGTPLVKDPFNADRWDYLYSIEKGSGETEQYQLSVYFENDQLRSFSGDFVPASVRKQPESDVMELTPPDEVDAAG